MKSLTVCIIWELRNSETAWFYYYYALFNTNLNEFMVKYRIVTNEFELQKQKNTLFNLTF